MNQLVKNERLKLFANGLNTIAVSFVVTGIVVPVISGFYGSMGQVTHAWAGVLWFLVGIHLHLLGLWVLGGLK